MRASALLVAVIAAACTAAPAPLVQLARTGDTLQLVASTGVRLNAEYAPRLVLASGDTLQLTTEARSTDSLWFAEPPAVIWKGANRDLDGQLRVSLCDNDAGYCRLLVEQVRNGQVLASAPGP